jgi:hypothetical protein
MRRLLVFLAFLIVVTEAYTLPPPQQEQAAAETVPEVQSDSGETAGKKSPAPAATFTPTEKIEADSAVSFPVDI